METEGEATPRVIISDALGETYRCFELVPESGQWHARLAWGLFREEYSTLKHGWSLEDTDVDVGFDLSGLAKVDAADSDYPLDLVDAIVELLERSPASPACHVRVAANIVDDALAARLTPWYRSRAGSSEGLIALFQRIQMSGERPQMFPSYWVGSTDDPTSHAGFSMYLDVPPSASEIGLEERAQLDRPEELKDLWWAIPNGVTHATGIFVNARRWILPVGQTPQEAHLVCFVYDRVTPFPPTLLPSGGMFDYTTQEDGARSAHMIQGDGDTSMKIEFVQDDRRRPGTVRIVQQSQR